MANEGDFFDRYLSYTAETEACAIYHRWCAIISISALLARNVRLKFGHFTVYPNIYGMLIGEPGARKTTAIKIAKKLLQQAGYHTFAPNKTSKEKFMAKLARGMNGVDSIDDILDENIFGAKNDTSKITECFICNDEFNNFIGLSNIDFISLLGEFWDYEGVYENELKNSQSDYIPNPTITILGGNTQTNFAAAFPSSVLGQGFFSRLLLIYGERVRPKITFPAEPAVEATEAILSELKKLRSIPLQEYSISAQGKALLDKIYRSWRDLDDPRFASYSNRRFNHLLKLVLVYTSTRYSSDISENDIIRANTILTYTEHYMPKALGEIGKSRHSDTSHKILQIILSAPGIVKFKDIWKHVNTDLEKMTDLATLIQNLVAADKIQQIGGDNPGFLPKRKVMEESDSSLVDFSILTDEERNMNK
jgi:hypothetical protein